jgi:putative PEP-CTERM system histidine kinase
VSGPTFVYATLLSYGFAAVAYALLAVRIGIGLRRSRHGALLLGAIVTTAAWAAAAAYFGASGSPALLTATVIAETVRYAFWYAFIGSLLAGAAEGPSRPILPRWLIATAGLLLAATVATFVSGVQLPWPEVNGRWYFLLQLCTAILGLVFVEQLYRSAHHEARWGIKPLVLMLAAMFGFDMLLYADALLFSRVDSDIWIARGLANALLIPFVVVATARNRGWTIEMHLSREVVFQSTALLVSGLVLLLFAGAGYIVRYLGGDWGRALQIELLFASALLVTLVMTSGRFRSRLRVFVSKHFFSYRFDYREEWLRFTRTLSTESTVLRTQERAIMALADLVESPGGLLWLLTDGAYRPSAQLNVRQVDASLARDDALAAFLERTGWVINVRDVGNAPSDYADLTLPAWLAEVPGAWLIVPLATAQGLIGFVVLVDPRTPVEVDWEVRDLLKAAARAAASYLAQIQMTEALLEARKFESFNRMSAFVVHDLKNLVAQLVLMLRNAERHRDNPEFQRDMLDTVAHVVAKMNALMLQLRTGTTPVVGARPVALAPVVRRVCATKAPTSGTIELDIAPDTLALGHEDRLEHVIGHLVQNAIDATTRGGTVRVVVRNEPRFAVVEVCDTGAGMSGEFIRERLFKPFETTKAAGMGIGVYESQQYVAALGGQILFESVEGQGTRVRVQLPRADGTDAPTPTMKEAA